MIIEQAATNYTSPQVQLQPEIIHAKIDPIATGTFVPPIQEALITRLYVLWLWVQKIGLLG